MGLGSLLHLNKEIEILTGHVKEVTSNSTNFPGVLNHNVKFDKKKKKNHLLS